MPVRDTETFEPLPGVEVGDCGAKLGHNSFDNGYVKFTHLRVPRDALLQRFVSITKEGDFEMNANPKIIYLIMVQTRVAISNMASF